MHADHLGRELKQLLNRFRPAKLEHNVLSINVSEVTQPPAQGFYTVRPSSSTTETQEPNPEDFSRLLRVPSDRPRRRGAEQRNERASLHISAPPKLGRYHIPHRGVGSWNWVPGAL